MLEDLRDYGLIKQRTVTAQRHVRRLHTDTTFHPFTEGDLAEIQSH